MYTPTMRKDERKTTITIHVDPLKVAKGHQAHRGGAGLHNDRRTKRLRTRSAQRRAALSD